MTVSSNGQVQVEEDRPDEHFEVFYAELRRFAQHLINQSGPKHHGATSLANRACARLWKNGPPKVMNKRHLMRLGAKVLRQVRIDLQRSETAQKRGGGSRPLSLSAAAGTFATPQTDPMAVFLEQLDAVEAFEKDNPKEAEIVNAWLVYAISKEELADLLETTRFHVEAALKLFALFLRRRRHG